MMFGWCWHRWGKWGDVEMEVRSFFDKDWRKAVGQTRFCEKCGKRQIRTLHS